MASRADNWNAPDVDFDWSAFWHEPGRFASFEDGPLSRSYYQSDRENELIRAFDELVKQTAAPGRVLEIGCGNGAGAAALLESADRLHRVLDIDAFDVVSTCPPGWLSDRVRFRKGNAEQIDFPDNTFDAVLSCFCIECCRPLQVLKECYRVLKVGGQIGMLIYARESPLVHTQSRYVGIYQLGLRQLLECASEGKPLDAELVSLVRHHIEEDVPQPHFRAHMQAVITQLLNLPDNREPDEPLCDLVFLPDVNGRENVDSLRSLLRRLSLMRAIDTAALDFREARQLCRDAFNMDFDDSCVIPVEYRYARLCWYLTGEKL